MWYSYLSHRLLHVNASVAYRTEGKIKDNEFDLPVPESSRVEQLNSLVNILSHTSSMRKYWGHDSDRFAVFSASE